MKVAMEALEREQRHAQHRIEEASKQGNFGEEYAWRQIYEHSTWAIDFLKRWHPKRKFFGRRNP